MAVDILAAVPHRPPFLLLDGVTALDDRSVRAVATLRPDDELWSRVYAGHYPGNPVTPGVLLCEMVFQAAAILVGSLPDAVELSGIPVVSRIREVKFKSMILPGDTVEVRAGLVERLANAYFMKGGVWKDGKAAMRAEFAVAVVPPPESPGAGS